MRRKRRSQRQNYKCEIWSKTKNKKKITRKINNILNEKKWNNKNN